MITYDFKNGAIVKLYNGVAVRYFDPALITCAELMDVLEWNDPNGDFHELERHTLLEILLRDFIVSKA
jgi:hypothetical protein